MKSTSAPQGTRQQTDPHNQDEVKAQIIPVIEESVTISRITEKTGKAVRVRIESHEEKQLIPLMDTVDEISIERILVGRYVDERTGPREEGNVFIIPLFETVSVVEQRLVLKEEIRIVRNKREVQHEEEVVLRKETSHIEHRTSEQDDWKPDFPA